MRIAHVSDIHIRNLRYHDEYRRVFDDLYAKLRELKPDLIINTGDTAHTKVQISPEFVQMTSEHIRSMAAIAPYHIILGNHDLNLMNRERQDAISPIVESLRRPDDHSANRKLPVYLHKKSGRVSLGRELMCWCNTPEGQEKIYNSKADGCWHMGAPEVNLWVFGMADSENYPRPSQWAEHSGSVNIGLFHGSVATCVTDSNWRMTHTEYDLSVFDGLDYCLMGDIHKQQYFNDRKFAYAGSLIQQNFGEDIGKGFLVWDIESKTEHQVKHVVLEGSRKFYTLRLNDDLSFTDAIVDEGSRLRIAPPREITLSEQKEIEKLAKQRYKPYDVITLSSTNIGSQRASVGKSRVIMENLRQIAVQEKLLRDYLQEKNLPEKVVERALDLNRKYQITLDQDDEVVRNISWKLNKLSWSNLFNYGETNLVDFDSLGGLTGIFAPNASGKSNFIDVILETCFDSTTRGVSKNIHLINDNKDQATMVADVTANGQNYIIERTIERIKYGNKKSGEQKEWGKTVVNFALVDELGEQQSALVGTLRPETERNIRQKLGTYEDMLLTTLSAQWNPMDLISCKETDRKKILFKFLDLDIFDEKYKMAKEEGKHFHKRLTEMENSNLEVIVTDLRRKVELHQETLKTVSDTLLTLAVRDKSLDDESIELASQKVKIDEDLNEATAAGSIADAEIKLKAIIPKIENLTESIEKFDSELGKIQNLEQKFDVTTFTERVERLKVVDADIDFRKRAIKDNTSDITSHRKSLKLLEEVPCGDQFPQCQFLVDAFKSREKLPVVETNVATWKADLEQLELERGELIKSKEKLDLYNSFMAKKITLQSSKENTVLLLENTILKRDALEKQASDGRERLERIRQAHADIAKNQEIDTKVSQLKSEKRELQRKINNVQAEGNEASRLLGSEEGILEKVAGQLDQLTELRETCVAFEHYAQAMGKDGIAYRILTQKLPLINEEINKILSTAADFSVVIEHDNEEQSIRIYIQYGEYKMRLLELGSGAEKMLASVAIRAALLSISSLPKPNMFILDEGFGKLDSRNIENVQKIFDYLKSVFEHVIVISHVDTMKDLVDNIIEIANDSEGYAHIEVGT